MVAWWNCLFCYILYSSLATQPWPRRSSLSLVSITTTMTPAVFTILGFHHYNHDPGGLHWPWFPSINTTMASVAFTVLEWIRSLQPWLRWPSLQHNMQPLHLSLSLNIKKVTKKKMGAQCPLHCAPLHTGVSWLFNSWFLVDVHNLLSSGCCLQVTQEERLWGCHST